MADPVITVRGRSDLSHLNRGLDQASGKVSSFASKAKRAAAVGLAVAGAAAVKFGVDAVKAASAAQQSIGATETVYGRYASRVIRDSNRAASAIGLSANEYRELANVSGAMLKASGIPLQKVTDLTAKLNERAADVAATFGGSTRDAVESFNALLRGETDPVERYGVAIKQTDVNARLAAKGLDKLEGKALKQASAQERLTLLFEQTADSAGQFGRESNTLAGQQQRLAARFENVQAKLGKLLLPVLTRLAEYASREVIPALEDLADWLAKNEDEFSTTAGTVKDTVLPVLETLGDIAGRVAGFVADLPAPVKELGVQAGIAALALPRLTAAMDALQRRGQAMAATMTTAQKRTAALSSAARTAAGVGGMVALTQATGQSNRAVSVLMSTLGGAGLGAAVGGPWGALIGGVGGLATGLLTMRDNTDASTNALSRAEAQAAETKAKYENLAATLDQVTGAISRQTRVEALKQLQDDGLVRQAQILGIHTRDLVGSMLGQEGAMRRVNKAGREHVDVLSRMEYQDLNRYLLQNRKALKGSQDQIRQNTRDLQSWKQALKGLPPRLQTEIKQLGASASIQEVRKLARQYGLTPKQLITRFEAAGIAVTGRQVRGLQGDIRSFGKVRPDDRWKDFFLGDISDAERGARRGADGIARNLRDGTGKARPNLGPFTSNFNGIISGLRGDASSGGRGVGDALGSGVQSGISSWVSRIAGAARSAVASAVAAARAAADARSPSRKTRRLGRDLGEGLVRGLRSKGRDARKAGKDVVSRVLEGIARERAPEVRTALGRINGMLEKSFSKRFKNEKRARLEKKRAIRALKDETTAVRRNAAKRERIYKRLERAEESLANLRQQKREYAAAIRDAALQYTAITNLDTAFNAPAMVRAMEHRLEKLRQFTAIIQDLKARGLDKALLDQLAQAGVEGGLAEALAIQQGGAAAIARFNELQAQINAVATELGDSTSSAMYDAGIKAAEGIVKGLESQRRNLERIARQLARDLARALRKELKIKSPSQVFRDIGVQTGKGLTIGLQDTHVRRAGQVLAGDLVSGFGRPKLTAEAVAGGTRSGLGAEPMRLTIKFTADQISALQRGKQIVADVDAYRGAGGKARSL